MAAALSSSARRYQAAGAQAGDAARFYLDETAWSPQPHAEGQAGAVAVRGTLINVNTQEEFKALDKAQLLERAGDELWRDVCDEGRALANPSLLNRFLLLSHADLKHHRYLYWFCFPALAPELPGDAPFATLLAASPLDMSEAQRREVQTRHSALGAPPFFAVVEGASPQVLRLSDVAARPELAASPSLLFAFLDPCPLPDHPGWPLRNLLVLLARALRVAEARVLCVRGVGAATLAGSRVLRVRLAPFERVRAFGWEKNAKGNAGPRLVDLRHLQAPEHLAAASVNLNLQLMRWRLLPELQLAPIASCRCLLLGAGTLGCAVARTLLGWNVRHVTLVDYGRVSFSNPARQWLFEFADCADGGAHKATAAAAALRRVSPAVDARGVVLTIPMPGHALDKAGEQQAERDAAALDALVREHDAVFLLTDSREARWLPTVLCRIHDRIAINCSLGFDSFLVMRHGQGAAASGGGGNKEGREEEEEEDAKEEAEARGARLGCYFCSDVVAPTDSLSARPLDQQCTVTRPGLSALASALAAELLVGLLQHPQRQRAPAKARTALGLVPHQLRGSLESFSLLNLVSEAAPHCTACSPAVVEAARREGWGFVRRALRDPRVLEEVSGLARIKAETDRLAAQVDADDWSAGDGDGDGDGDDF